MDETAWVALPGEGAALREVVFYGEEAPPAGLLARALARTAVTLYTGGGWITAGAARDLAELARQSEHSLDVRIVLHGGVAALPEPLRLLDEAGLAPALALREPAAAPAPVRLALLGRLRALGARRPRLIVVPHDGPVEQRYPSSLEGGMACEV